MKKNILFTLLMCACSVQAMENADCNNDAGKIKISNNTVSAKSKAEQPMEALVHFLNFKAVEVAQDINNFKSPLLQAKAIDKYTLRLTGEEDKVSEVAQIVADYDRKVSRDVYALLREKLDEIAKNSKHE